MNPIKKIMMGIMAMRCTCKKCPSYPECKDGKCDKVLYCGRGASSLTIKRNGCICKACPVYKMKNLSEDYYCIIGKAKEVK